MSANADSLRSILYALGANFAIAMAKTAGAVYTGSSSMLAEAIHSYADCGNQGLLIWGLFSIYEGAHKLHQTEPMKNAWVAVAILGFGVVAEAFSLWGCLREIDKNRGDLSLWRWFRVSRQSELLVVLGEDIAALGGLAVALGFILLAMATGNPMWDAVGSIVIGTLLVLVAILVGIEVKALLVGQSAEPRVLERMRTHLATQPEVEQVYNLLTQQLGSEIMVAVKARMKPQHSDVDLIGAINRVERSLKDAFPEVRWVFFEPDLAD